VGVSPPQRKAAMKGKIIKIAHNGHPFQSNEFAMLIATGMFHHYVLIK
jgi:hypothetical protein